MKIRTTQRTSHTLTLDDDTELELQHEPIEYTVLTHQAGDKIVVAYLVQDSDHSCNPMMEYDAQGKLYTRSSHRRRLISDDDGEFMSALGLDSYGSGSPDIDRDFMLDGKMTNLREIALESGIDADDSETKAYEFYKQHWRAIVGPYVVPVSYFDGQGVSISVTTWDGDVDDLPTAVWVADEGAIGNLTYEGKVPTQKEIDEYARCTLNEYEQWCNGYVYGCVVETFEENNGDWTAKEEEACWGFIGDDNAKETLKSEFFDPAVKAL